jgi:2-(1,2-epoxy-1,2-dihydrophenyl)acetyl-CoA isomerase
MTYEDISLAVDGAVATITVRRPDKLNALRDQTADELVAVLRALESNDDMRVVILTGEGRAFGAGYDLSTVDLGGASGLGQVLERHFNPLIRTIRRSRLLVVSAVNGPCAGVSVGIALAGDVVLASSAAYFYEPFAQIALVPDGGNTFFFPRVAGRTRAMAAMLLGDRIPAEEAATWGLIWRVVEPDDLMAEARRVADRIARVAPLAIQRTKQLVNTACETALDAQLDLERDFQGELDGRPEMIDAVSRFLSGGKRHR